MTFGERVTRRFKWLGLPVYVCMLAWRYFENKSLEPLDFLASAICLIAGVLLDGAMEHLFFIKPKCSAHRQKTP